MKHPTDERLRAYLDGELPLPAAAAVGNHLAACADCGAVAAALRETAEVFAGAMARMDAAEPARWAAGGDADGWATVADGDLVRRPLRFVAAESGSAEPVIRAARSGPTLVREREPAPARRRAAAPLLRWAAGIALMVAVGGSAAIASGLLQGRGGEEGEPATVTAAPADAVPEAGGGVLGRPVNGAMEVLLTRAPAGSRVIVGWTDGADVIVDVTGAPEARVLHRDGEERMVANLADRAGVVRVTMPRGLRSATVVWQGRIVIQVADGAVTPVGATAEGVVLRAQR
jgi:anti-sigma factor RsiW